MTYVLRTSGLKQLHVRSNVSVASIDTLNPATRRLQAHESIIVAEPIQFGKDSRTDLLQLLILREATRRALPVEWKMLGIPLLNLHEHVHIVPPVEGLDEAASKRAASWKAAYRYGSFYYRVGPGYVVIKDVREGGEHARMTIGGDGAQHFLDLASGANAAAPLSVAAAASLLAMKAAGLAATANDVLMVLPFRMQQWPVPFLAV